MVDSTMNAARTPALYGFHAGSGRTTIKVAPPAARVSLRASSQDIAGLSAALGLALPQRPKASSIAGGRSALWLGPDEWLVIDEDQADLVGICAGAGCIHSAMDISHRNIALLVLGPDAGQILNSGCPQDLSPGGFPVGACSRTVFGKVEVVLWRTHETAFRIECWRSFADYVSAFLAEATEMS